METSITLSIVAIIISTISIVLAFSFENEKPNKEVNSKPKEQEAVDYVARVKNMVKVGDTFHYFSFCGVNVHILQEDDNGFVCREYRDDAHTGAGKRKYYTVSYKTLYKILTCDSPYRWYKIEKGSIPAKKLNSVL